MRRYAETDLCGDFGAGRLKFRHTRCCQASTACRHHFLPVARLSVSRTHGIRTHQCHPRLFRSCCNARRRERGGSICPRSFRAANELLAAGGFIGAAAENADGAGADPGAPLRRSRTWAARRASGRGGPHGSIPGLPGAAGLLASTKLKDRDPPMLRHPEHAPYQPGSPKSSASLPARIGVLLLTLRRYACAADCGVRCSKTRTTLGRFPGLVRRIEQAPPEGSRVPRTGSPPPRCGGPDRR